MNAPAEKLTLVTPDAKPRHGSETRQRTRLVQVRCTDTEHKAIAQAAEQAGETVGAFMRRQAIGTPGPRAKRRPLKQTIDLAKLLANLGRPGSNLNQIARALNAGGGTAPGELAEAIAEFRAVIAEIMRALGRRHGD